MDYLDTIDPSVDHTGWDVRIDVELGKLGDAVLTVRRATQEAADASRAAARESRAVVRELRSASIPSE